MKDNTFFFSKFVTLNIVIAFCILLLLLSNSVKCVPTHPFFHILLYHCVVTPRWQIYILLLFPHLCALSLAGIRILSNNNFLRTKIVNVRKILSIFSNWLNSKRSRKQFLLSTKEVKKNWKEFRFCVTSSVTPLYKSVGKVILYR